MKNWSKNPTKHIFNIITGDQKINYTTLKINVLNFKIIENAYYNNVKWHIFSTIIKHFADMIFLMTDVKEDRKFSYGNNHFFICLIICFFPFDLKES